MKVPPKFRSKCRKKKNIPAGRKVILRDKVGKWKMIWKVKVPNNSIRPWEVIQKYLSRCLIVFNRIQRYKVRQQLLTLFLFLQKNNAIQYFFFVKLNDASACQTIKLTISSLYRNWRFETENWRICARFKIEREILDAIATSNRNYHTRTH